MINNKSVSILFGIVALGLMVYFFLTTQIWVELSEYFKPEYYTKFSMLIISVMLINAAILLFRNRKGVNLALAIFGYTVVQEILFDAFNVTTLNMPIFASIVLFICAASSVWIAHTNTFNTEKLSKKGLMISLAIGAIETLFPLLL